jgi:uncharacterized protein
MSEDSEGGAGMASTGRTVAERKEHRLSIMVPDRGNPKLRRLIELVNADDELYGLWLAANVNAMERLGMTDHGPVHVKIVMNLAVKLVRALAHAGIPSSIERNYGMSAHDAEVIVALAALLHDTGMSIHRTDHEAMSLFVVQPVLRRFLAELYDDMATATVIRSETLHAIIGHRAGGRPLTIEAGVVRVADALDMAKGRSRIPFEAGSVSIHSISAAAIEGVRIEEGTAKAVRIAIEMSNSAGVFQLDQLFREKLQGSGLEPYIELEANLEGETEKRLLQRFRI